MDDRKQDNTREMKRTSPKAEREKSKRGHPSIAEISEPLQPASFSYRN